MSREVPAPEVPDSVLDENGWVKLKEEQDVVSIGPLEPLQIQAYMYTRMYRDAGLQREVRKNTLGKFDRYFNVFFATRTHIEPPVDNLPFGVGRDQVLEFARMIGTSEFEERMHEEGVRDVKVVGRDTLTTEYGVEAELDEVRASYDISCIDVEVTDQRVISIEGGEIDLTGWIGIWHHTGDVFVAGGVYPTEDFERSQAVDLTDGIDVEIDIDLDIWPRPYKDEMFNLIRGVR